MVTYRLKIDVQNINDPPTVIDNPDLTSLGEIINGIPNILEGEYSSLNPNNLFEDKDFIFEDSLSFEIEKIKKIYENEEEIVDNIDWINLSTKTSIKPESDNKFLIEPLIFSKDSDGNFTNKVLIENLSELDKGTNLKIYLAASDNRNVFSKGFP